MGKTIDIGIIGDLDQSSPARQAINDALSHAAKRMSTELNIVWLPTESLLKSEVQQGLRQFAGLWASAGTYRSQEGAIRAIRFARESDWPFIGT